MNFTEEHLDEVEEMAGLFFSAEDIAINLELDDEQTELFITAIEAKKTDFPFVAAFLKGWFSAEVTLRRAIRQSALNGSSPSQQAMLNYQREARS